MSGGHFSYKQYDIQYMADEIEHIIETNDCEDLDEWNYGTNANIALNNVDAAIRARSLK